MTSHWVHAAAAALLLAIPGVSRAEPLSSLDCPSEPSSIVVLGDSLADGLWGSFYRAFIRCDQVTVLRRTTVSDGLAKTSPEEWMTRLGPEAQNADLIVVQIGANDITNIREGTTRHTFGTDEWRATYQDRAERLVTALQGTAPQVVWMGLPIVGQERFEPSYREITALQEAAVTAAGAKFVDTHEPTTFGGDEFVMTAQYDGSMRQMRVTDQVHFTELGYDVVAGLLHGDVEKIFSAGDRAAGLDGLTLQ
ncbi:GDSL-type esterase/lipase family protein [Pelagovum pacificum]|uniref:DUF459 domain-containing protein n=1 Tax=Pelagovum pacificum TaxID=2588711 RepID=A0A5C5GC84_9RHOB|nr:GDSL-type esterase/lipase family protein [Pelagovum pacificum]QQA44473.1 DUF459 domain-containing protein [Pelagovum pacificum]TNY32412.1 DUF459 domain-containing protein [Pelagovum pacificum]